MLRGRARTSSCSTLATWAQKRARALQQMQQCDNWRTGRTLARSETHLPLHCALMLWCWQYVVGLRLALTSAANTYVWQMSKEDRKAVRDYLRLAARPVGQPEGQ